MDDKIPSNSSLDLMQKTDSFDRLPLLDYDGNAFIDEENLPKPAEINEILLQSLSLSITESNEDQKNDQLEYLQKKLIPFAQKVGLTGKFDAKLLFEKLIWNLRFRYNLPQNLRTLIDSSRFDRDYSDCAIIGSGGFGVVHKAIHRLDGRVYAIKQMTVDVKDSKLLYQIQREIVIHSQLEHINIVRYHQSWTENRLIDFNDEWTDCDRSNENSEFNSESRIDEFNSKNSFQSDLSLSRSLSLQQAGGGETTAVRTLTEMPVHVLFIQMEYCSQNLSDWLELRNMNIDSSSKCLNLNQQQTALQLFHQIVQGVGYLHQNHILHRDLKPANILLQQDGGSDKWRVKLCDFGLSRPYIRERHLELQLSTLQSLSSNASLTQDLGTTIYLAPELNSQLFNSLNKSPVTSSSSSSTTTSSTTSSSSPTMSSSSSPPIDKGDMYSLGVILLELCHPFTTRQELVGILCKRHSLPLDIPPALADLIGQLLQTDFIQRPSCADILYQMSLLDLGFIQSSNVLLSICNSSASSPPPPPPDSSASTDLDEVVRDSLEKDVIIAKLNEKIKELEEENLRLKSLPPPEII